VAQGSGAEAFIAVLRGGANEVLVPVGGRLVVGRECAGVPEGERLLVRDESVSRKHLEIQLDFAGDRAWVVDVSSNGTLLNGSAMARAIPVPLRAGDQLTLGSVRLEFRSARFQH
jgi:adenylate cyclase